MPRDYSECEHTEYWASIDLEPGDSETIQDHERYCDLDVETLSDRELISVTFESSFYVEEFIEIVKEILGDE